MNEQLQQALSDLINKSLSGVDATKDFLVEQTPDVIQQLLLWYGIYKFILFGIGIILIAIIIYGNYRQIKFIIAEIKSYKPKSEWDSWAKNNRWVAINIAQLLWGIPLAVTLNLEWIKIWIAPKIWLIEYISKLIEK